MKVKTVISEEKKHIRFADWSAHDVSDSIDLLQFMNRQPCFLLIKLNELFICRSFLDRSAEQIFILNIKTSRVLGEFVG